LKSTPGRQLPGWKLLGSLLHAVAAPPPRTGIARIGCPALVVLGTAVPRSATGVAVGRLVAGRRLLGPAARAAWLTAVSHGEQRQYHKPDGVAFHATSIGHTGRRAATATGCHARSPAVCPACQRPRIQRGISPRRRGGSGNAHDARVRSNSCR
jgi:hypothetical protein